MFIRTKNLIAGPVSLPGPLPRLKINDDITTEITPEEYDRIKDELGELADTKFIEILVETTGSTGGNFVFDNDAGILLFKGIQIAPFLIAVIDVKAAVATSTTDLGNITLSGEQTLNGVTTSMSRVLVTEQTLPQDNGIYVTATGAWSRATDADEDIEVTNGNITHVIDTSSTKYKFKYLLVTANPITVGTTGQTWEEHRDIDFGTTAGTATEGNDTRVPSQDENDALAGTDGTPSSSNKYVTNSDSRNTDDRDPNSHGLGDGARHSSATIAQLNALVSDATLDDSSASRPPSGVAGGDLGGSYPNPTVDDGADSTAIHDNVSGEISAISSKSDPVAGDIFVIENSESSDAKASTTLGDIADSASTILSSQVFS